MKTNPNKQEKPRKTHSGAVVIDYPPGGNRLTREKKQKNTQITGVNRLTSRR